MRKPLAVVMTLVFVAACTSGTSPSPSSAPASTPPAVSAAPSSASSASAIPVVEVPIQLDFQISTTVGPLLWGIDKGFFEEAGIDLDLIPGNGSDLALNQVDSGNVDFAFLDGQNYIAARAKDLTKTTAIYAYVNISTTAIAAKEAIESPQDLAGKSFGTIPQSSGRQKIPTVLEMNDVDPASVPIELMDFSVLYPALFEGTIDTAEVGFPGHFEGIYLQGQEQGIELFVAPISDWGYRDYGKVLVVSNALIEEN